MLVSDITGAARDLYNATGDTYFSDTLMWNWLWKAQTELVEQGWLLEATTTSSTVASQQAYSFPTNALAIVRVTVNGKKLKRITFRQDDAMTLSNANITATGIPIYYTIWNNQILLRSIPDNVYTMVIYSFNQPAQITSASQTPDIDTHFHFDLVDYLLWRMYGKDQNAEMAMFYKRIWDEHIIDARRHRARVRRTDSFKTVQDEETLPVTILGEA